ncbi:helix-turn-helix transcriptional regulator [Streptomyces sp. B8F3]|uniref:helix-turn-helix transcriptional regulator n=1 Tax=Streptomyces sp. B8F3 TaxID=3153573 RepID=UPI00325C5857
MTVKRIRLAQRRKACGYTQESFADHLGVERSTVGRWESADTEPQPWLRPRMARALNLADDDLQALLDDITVIQRQPSERMAFVLQNPASADLVAVASLHERVRQLDESYDTASSTSLMGAAGQVHGQVKVLRQHAASARVRRALFEVESDSATLMSQLVWDVSQRRDHRAPLRYLDEAVTAARHGRDATTEAYAVLRKSFVALYGEKDPMRGGQLADQAAAIAQFTSPSLTGLALLHVAEAHAMTDRPTECETALEAAESQFYKVGDDDVAAPYYTINEYNRLAGSCYLFLGLPERAEPILRSAATALRAKKKSQAITLGNLTLALIRQRKLDEATATMHRTIDAVELTRGGGGLNVAFSAGRELRPWRHESWAQEINDRLLALMAAI